MYIVNDYNSGSQTSEHQNHLEGLLKHSAESHPRDSESVGMEEGDPRICTSAKFPGESDVLLV